MEQGDGDGGAGGELTCRRGENAGTTAQPGCVSDGACESSVSSACAIIPFAKAANVDHIGLMTPKIMAGQ